MKFDNYGKGVVDADYRLLTELEGPSVGNVKDAETDMCWAYL